MTSFIPLYLTLRQRLQREDGAIALATLAFMVTTGMIAIVTLWSIAYATGAYNQLYNATQTAAYAAVGYTVSPSSSAQAQLNFDCGPGGAASDGTCSGGSVMQIVNATISELIPPPGSHGNFGLTFQGGTANGSVYLADNSNNFSDSVHAYYVPLSPANAKNVWQSLGSPQCPAQYSGGPTGTGGGGSGASFLCWTILEQPGLNPIGGNPIFTSGIVVHTYVPGLRLPGCFVCASLDLSIEAAAEQGQVTPNPPPAPPVIIIHPPHPPKGNFPPVASTPLPVISPAKHLKFGTDLTTTNGTWTGSVGGYAYQWLRCNISGNKCSFISGATSSSYIIPPISNSTYEVQVTASNAYGSATETSAATQPVLG